MESFNAILKKEEVNLYEYKTFDEARLAIFEFIERQGTGDISISRRLTVKKFHKT